MNEDFRAILFEKMLTIRLFEQTLEEMFKMGHIRGTMHGSIGQEAVAVGVLTNVDLSKDFVTGTHRSHGHFLALTDDVFSLASELMGKATGLLQGKGASQHLHYKRFFTNGITGGMFPIAVGLGMSKKLKNEPGVVISFIGDGGMNEGYVMESLNLASVFSTPNIFILENNHYAMSTITKKVTGGSFKKRAEAFGLKYYFLRALDVEEVYSFFREIYLEVSEKRLPVFVEFETYRFCGHSKSDKREYVIKELEDYWRKNDPLKRIESRLPSEIVQKIRHKVEERIKGEFEKAMKAPEPSVDVILKKSLEVE